MKKIISLSFILLLGTLLCSAQEKNFIISGQVNLPDGTDVSISQMEDTMVELATTQVKDRHFVLRGKVAHPVVGLLATNNLQLVDKNKWADDSIHWNYIDIFVSACPMTMGSDLIVKGSPLNDDFLQYNAQEKKFNPELPTYNAQIDSLQWDYIQRNPQSVLSAYFVNNMLKRGYNLTKAQVERISKAITAVPDDTLRWNEYLKRTTYARKTVIGAPLIDLEIYNKVNQKTHLSEVVRAAFHPTDGKQDPKLLLIDFWASWCGQCLAAFPEIEKISKKYGHDFQVIDLSIDVKDAAWRIAMQKHPQPWQQYCTTKTGYQNLFSKYQIGNGVPYFVMVTPDGNVMRSPKSVDEISDILSHTLK
jgi:thiol-disulfide isomerase/thioredoxin